MGLNGGRVFLKSALHFITGYGFCIILELTEFSRIFNFTLRKSAVNLNRNRFPTVRQAISLLLILQPNGGFVNGTQHKSPKTHFTSR